MEVGSPLTIYSLDTGVLGGPRTKIGACNAVTFRNVEGSILRFVSSNVQGDEIYLERWDGINFGSTDPATAAALTNNAPVIIAALVHMLGGSVTLQSCELRAAETSRAVVMDIRQDPWMMTLRQEIDL